MNALPSLPGLPTLPILSILLALPLLGAATCFVLRDERTVRAVAIATATLALAAALAALLLFDGQNGGFQLQEKHLWIPGLNVHYFVGIDGLSVLFLPATTLLFLCGIVTTGRGVKPLPNLHFALILLFETATLGIFCALDTLLFFFFWELTLLPLYFLIGLWGLGAHGRAAATRYFLVMLVGGVPLLFAFIALAANAGWAFDLPTLLAQEPTHNLQLLVFVLFLIGFGVKVPVVPLHTWMPSLALGGPAAVTALMVGLKLGAYGLLRFAIPLAPTVAQELHWLLAGLGTVGILYGAVAALAQSNLRNVVAYASVSHVGMVLLALASFSVASVQGAVLLLLSFSISTGGLFLLLGILQRRLGSTDLSVLGGVRQRMPRLAAAFLVFGLTGLGLPGTSGFPAEFLIIVSTLQTHSGAALAALFGMVVGAGAFLGPYRAAFFGPIRHAAVAEAEDLLPREYAVAGLFLMLTLVFGLYPMPWLELMRTAAESWVLRLPAVIGA